MAKESIEEALESLKSTYADDPEECFKAITFMVKEANEIADHYRQEITILENGNNILKKKNEDLLHVVTELHHALNGLYDAHEVSWFGQHCHCNAHQKAKEVMMNVALWATMNKRPEAK